MFTYDQQDPVQRQRVHDLYYGLYEEAKKRGYGMYRAHVNHMGMACQDFVASFLHALIFPDLIANLNDFNNHAYNRFVEKIKVRHSPCLRDLR